MNGESVDLQHGITVLSFIYTRCPDPRMCPLVTAKFARMATAPRPAPRSGCWRSPSTRRSIRPPCCGPTRKAAGADGVRWTLATGEAGAIAAFAERAGLIVDRPRPGLINHTEAVLIAQDGRLERNIAGNDWSAPEVAAEARSIATLPSDPIARFGLRLFGGVVQMCGAAAARGFSPLMLLTLVGGDPGRRRLSFSPAAAES